MTAKTILNMFEEYRRARITFVQTVADLALRPQNIDVLKSASVMELLRPMLSDVCIQIQQCAAVAIGRLAHHDSNVAAQMLHGDVLQLLLRNLEQRNKYYKKSAMFVLRSVCKHDPELAAEVISGGGLEAIVLCLADHDSEVKESATWATGYAARHGHALARALVDAGAVPHLILCLQEPELAVRRVAASALADIAKHGVDLAQHVSDAGAVPFLSRALHSRDDRLKRQALMALSAVARHQLAQAETVVQADVFPDVLVAMGHSCPLVRRNAAMLVRDVAKHSSELAQLVANMGGVGALVVAARDETMEVKVPAITALGYIGGHGQQLASCVVASEGVQVLAELLGAPKHEYEYELLCIAVWALGQLGRHCPAAVATAEGVLARLLYFYARNSAMRMSVMVPGGGGSITAPQGRPSIDRRSTQSGVVPGYERPSCGDVDHATELRARCKTALRQSVQGCTTLSALEPLLHANCPPDILKHVLGQFAKVLPKDARARRLFVTTGGLGKVQEIEADPGTATMEYITIINACFPEEIVRYYTPGYPDSLLEKVEQFVPRLELDAEREEQEGEPPGSNLGPPPSANNSQDLMDYMNPV